MSGVRAPHLQRRNGIYHLRVRVPDDLKLRMGMLEVRRSLGTYKPTRARTLAAIYAARVKEVFEMVRERELSKDQARSLVIACFENLAAETNKGILPETDRPDLEFAEQRELARERAADLRSGLGSQGAVQAVASGVLCDLGLGLSDIAPSSRADVLEGVARALIEQQRLFMHRLEDRLSPFAPADPLFTSAATVPFGRVGLDRSDEKAHHPPLPGPPLRDAVEAYLSAKKARWTAKTHASRVRQLSYLEEHVGGDMPLSAITSHDIRAFRDALGRMRRNHGRAGIVPIAKKQTENVAHRIDGKTAVLIFEPTKAFFKWAKSEQGYIERNPAEDVRIDLPKAPKGKRPRRPFSSEELHRLFSAPLFTGCRTAKRRFDPGSVIIKDARYWIPILGFYTGARVGELIQLHLADVEISNVIPYIHISEDNAGSVGTDTAKHVKSEAGVRKVPLHPDLISLGFVDFVLRRRRLKRQSKRLFFEIDFGADGQASTIFSKWFGRLMDRIGLDDPVLVFHSFRHNAEDAFRNAGQQQYVIDRIIGHSNSATSAGYGEGIDLETAYVAVAAMKLKIRIPDILAKD